MEISVKGFQECSTCPYNHNIFSDVDFLSSSVTDKLESNIDDNVPSPLDDPDDLPAISALDKFQISVENG
ncbi:hypothetical protein PGB90_008403 [Kerria lacca]